MILQDSVSILKDERNIIHFEDKRVSHYVLGYKR